MKSLNQLREVLEVDPLIAQLKDIKAVHTEHDPNHLERRQQQRAVPLEYIKVALAYGTTNWSYGAKVYTIGDRNLRGTKYERYISNLRGLQIVTAREATNVIRVMTVTWKRGAGNDRHVLC